LARNSDHIDSTLASIDKFTGALGRNSDSIETIIAGLKNLAGGADGKSGEINEAARSIKTLADNLDRRAEELTVEISRLTKTGTRTLSTIDKAAKNFDANPSRIIWGGAPPNEKAKETKAAPAATKKK
jgi:phospholipid/cholesterol/gamma-HCH transport system substrate-binding protein